MGVTDQPPDGDVSRSPQAWFDRGNIALTRGENREAIRNYETATTIWPEHWAAWVNMGTAYGALDEPGFAVRAFEQVIEATQGKRAFRVVEARAQFNRALMLMKQVRNVEAARGFENMLEVFPDHLTSHANLGFICSNNEDLDEKATMHLNRALEMETNPERRQMLQDFLEAIAKRRARLDRVAGAGDGPGEDEPPPDGGPPDTTPR